MRLIYQASVLLAIVVALVACSRPRIVVLKFASHPALDACEAALCNALEAARATNSIPSDVEIVKLNANRDAAQAKQLAEVATAYKPLAIIALGPPAAQAVSRTPSSVPLIYGAVSDPDGAGITPSTRATGIKNVGPAVIARALEFIQTAFPETKTVGSLYNPAEQNSVYVQDLIRKECETRRLSFVALPVNGPGDLGPVTEGLLARVEALYSANDNTVNIGATTLD